MGNCKYSFELIFLIKRYYFTDQKQFLQSKKFVENPPPLKMFATQLVVKIVNWLASLLSVQWHFLNNARLTQFITLPD